jgi:protein-disulfide isomerase
LRLKKGEFRLICYSLSRRNAVALALLAALTAPMTPALLAQAAQAPQTNVPPAPAAQPAQVAGPVFPKPEPTDFTADSPTKEQVEAFLQASWGYDPNRVYEIARIVKTATPGISNVVVLVGEKGRKETGALQFFAMPDGKHIIANNEMLPFGPHPYADNRAKLLELAVGPSQGASSKDLEIVEFADFQCPHCKDAQPTVQKILTDFPKAHFVFESFPLPQHPQAFRAAEYGVCVAKLGGDKAFFDYDIAVYDGQAGLATDEGATLTLNSAVTKAGQDPAKVEECVKTPEAKATVDASVKLARELNVNETPWLFINGRGIPLLGVNYDTIKEMISRHSANDGPAK